MSFPRRSRTRRARLARSHLRDPLERRDPIRAALQIDLAEVCPPVPYLLHLRLPFVGHPSAPSRRAACPVGAASSSTCRTRNRYPVGRPAMRAVARPAEPGQDGSREHPSAACENYLCRTDRTHWGFASAKKEWERFRTRGRRPPPSRPRVALRPGSSPARTNGIPESPAPQNQAARRVAPDSRSRGREPGVPDLEAVPIDGRNSDARLCRSLPECNIESS